MVVVAANLSGCPTSNEGGGGGDITGGFCETEGPDGAWETSGPEDWTNVATEANHSLFFDTVGTTTDDIEDPGDPEHEEFEPVFLDCDDPASFAMLHGSFDRTMVSHHCFTTAVHAVHLATGELLLMHGENDQRVWDIGSPAGDMTWHPVPIRTDVGIASVDTWDAYCRVPDLFCSGHVQLYDGRVFVAGGNVTGSPSGGGVSESYLFDPVAAALSPAPGENAFSTFGWAFEGDADERGANYRTNAAPRASFDRWYPTLTALPDGRVLVAGGDSRETWTRAGEETPMEAAATRVLEVYDPLSGEMEELPGGEDAWFPRPTGIPQYPFMFVLPNGHVFYAGSEEAGPESEGGASTLEHFGQILVPTERGSQDPWTWVELGDGIVSFIRGGSAVMYEPGKIVKSGGIRLGSPAGNATADVETIDLTAYASADPEPPPTKFCSSADPDPDPGCAVETMNERRHFHTLTLLPDGRVLATGGNRYSNASERENFRTRCDYGETEILEMDCTEGCPSVCVQTQGQFANDFNVACDTEVPPTYACSIIGTVPCSDAGMCAAITDIQECEASPSCHVDGTACVPTYTCGELLDGATCVAGYCHRDCDVDMVDDDCGEILPYEDPDQADEFICPARSFLSLDSPPEVPPGTQRCSPANNACYATHSAEIWDPQCGTWTPLGEQAYPRMYHSTALLLPNARVISMGGGHRGYPESVRLAEQPISEYFAPSYTGFADAPLFDGISETIAGSILYPGPDDQGPQAMMLQVQDVDGVEIDHVALVKLGSVTHGFDMGQSYMKLDAVAGSSDTQIGLAPSDDPAFPFNANTAPPGYYMAFLMSTAGEPSHARYVQVGGVPAASFVCEAAGGLVAEHGACTAEPISGLCPTGEQDTESIDLPTVDAGTGQVTGFRVVAPAGSVGDPTAPSVDELAGITDRCVTACEQFYEARLGQSANCGDPEAFETPVLDDATVHAPVDYLHSTHRHGEGLFAGDPLDCDLGTDCWTEFDEELRPMASDRVTPAADTVGIAEDWRLEIAGDMSAWASTGGSPVTSSIVGTVGYSECAGGNDTGPCAFYLGSLEFSLAEELVLPVQCGSSTDAYTLEELTVRLEQPAFGIAEQDTAWKGFAPGTIVLDAEGVVEGLPFHVRRANHEPLYLRAGEGWTLLQGTDGAWLEFSVPCGEEETAEILVWWGYSGVSLEDRRPVASISVPSTVTCPSTVALTKSVADDDDDLASARWIVDGVLMEEGITSMSFTQPHVLELVARDARGATVTARKEVACE